MANLMGLPIDTVKASGDRHLTLFAFVVCGLIMFLNALGYVSVELVDFLFQIEKGANLAQECLYKNFCQVFAPSIKFIEEFLESEWPLNLSIEELIQNLRTLTY
ncbi:hypothetical protein Goklo_006458 [Gossypium klotzschianum]|uniref:Uncharacterized protein n=1 Tax=Gossypium klotzschianum TaxID=34286 RepID=A0A7J8VHM8_9ROSI|nr:hypothetical protein [Gossypium klotzschianum]